MKRSINNKTPNKGGRPTKRLSEKRKYRITVKMATEEYYAMKLKAKNAGVSASEIVRMAIRDCHIRARLTTEQADYIRKLCGMANNLNQLTRKAHREGVRLHYGQLSHKCSICCGGVLLNTFYSAVQCLYPVPSAWRI